MPDLQPLGSGGLRLKADFEPGPDGKPATVAYRCPGGRWTLGEGATEWPNGDLVKQGDICTEEQADELTAWSVRKFAATVDDFIKQPMTQNQRDAFIMLAYNIGPHAFQNDCAASAYFNDEKSNREVAAAFGRWCKATSSGPEESDLDKPYYQSIMRLKPGGDPKNHTDYEWVGQDGQACKYQRAFPGLLRRHLSEACLFLDLDWSQSCRKDTVSIVSHREWDPNDKRWEDRVQTKTELADILPVALKYPLPAEPLTADSPEPAGEQSAEAFPSQPAPAQALPAGKGESAKPQVSPTVGSKQPSPGSDPVGKGPVVSPTGSGGAGGVSRPAPSPLPPLPKPPILIAPRSIDIHSIPYGEIDAANGAKNMSDSRRVIGMVIVGLGSVVQIVATRMGVASVFGAVFFDLSRDPVVIALVVGGIVAICGLATRKHGTKVITKGMVEATCVLK